MKHRVLLALLLCGILAVLSSCGMLYTGMNSLLSGGTAAGPAQAPAQAAPAGQTGDTVTISRQEYERLMEYSELFDIMDIADEVFYRETDHTAMLENAARGMLVGLEDPYTFYYNPEEFADMWEDDEGNYVGIGVLISANYETQECTIVRVFDDSPAKEAGVRKGDILYRVGEDLYVNADNLNEAVSIMRGESGTSVDVTLIRDGEEITLNILRREVNVNQVESTMLDQQIGYIQLYQFAGHCDQEFESALNRLVSQDAKGIIVDLRDNPGGWVDQACRIADLFMDEGELCYLVYRDGSEDHSEYLTKNGKTDIPLVILQNEYSASSSEILSGALRDRANAEIVGTTSFGKGIVQGVYWVGSRGAGMQVTIASYRTPDGHEVHEVGIEPDVVCELPEGEVGDFQFADVENDPQLKKAIEVMTEKIR